MKKIGIFCYYTIVFGWVLFIFLFILGQNFPIYLKIGILGLGISLLLFGSIAFIIYMEPKYNEDVSKELEKLKESQELYDKAKKALENYVYSQIQKDETK